MSIIRYSVFATKLGWAGLSAVLGGPHKMTQAGIAGNQAKIKEIILPDTSKEYVLKRLQRNSPRGKRNSVGLKKIIKSLRRYLSGERESLSFPVDLSNYTAFERRVYRALTKVRYGEVRTYDWLARRVGHPRAARAVGNALAKNPAPLVIPCHRIIPGNGKIGNFSARGGPELKAKLLAMEKKRTFYLTKTAADGSRNP